MLSIANGVMLVKSEFLTLFHTFLELFFFILLLQEHIMNIYVCGGERVIIQ